MAIAEIPRHTSDSSEVLKSDEAENLSSEVLHRIAKLRALTDNWDGYRSPPIAEEAIGGALHILQEAQDRRLPEPYIGPVSGGGVQLEWHLPNGHEVEMSVAADGSVEFITINRGEYSDDMRLSSYFDAYELLEWLKSEED